MRLGPSLVVLLGAGSAWGFCRTTTSLLTQPDPTQCPRAGAPIAWTLGCVEIHLDPMALPRAPEPMSRELLRRVLTEATGRWAGASCGASESARPSFQVLLGDDRRDPTGYFPDGANYNSVRFRELWPRDSFHPPDAAAVTIVTFGSASARILDADTELNLRSDANPGGFTFSVTGSPTAADLPTIVLHELGHLQGLAHSSERSAVMWFSAGQGEQRRTLTDDDARGLCAIYPPERRVVCEPGLQAQWWSGGGLQCATGAVRGVPGWLLALALAALGALRRGRSNARR
ncbi:MAG: matrixin family metalloprotease [Deltaproteobacteria bacterium]|nr:matrixin family metalloprotease [Deltaproteobacteria bacterium]